jgi:hypothetical protein
MLRYEEPALAASWGMLCRICIVPPSGRLLHACYRPSRDSVKKGRKSQLDETEQRIEICTPPQKKSPTLQGGAVRSIGANQPHQCKISASIS